jgi:hypothetical protein
VYVRRVHGEHDTYSLACSFAEILLSMRRIRMPKYRTYCLPDIDIPRTNTRSLEYVLWSMARPRWQDRTTSIPQLRKLLDAITEM